VTRDQNESEAMEDEVHTIDVDTERMEGTLEAARAALASTKEAHQRLQSEKETMNAQRDEIQRTLNESGGSFQLSEEHLSKAAAAVKRAKDKREFARKNISEKESLLVSARQSRTEAEAAVEGSLSMTARPTNGELQQLTLDGAQV
jgi:chromosome segregation ATPase